MSVEPKEPPPGHGEHGEAAPPNEPRCWCGRILVLRNTEKNPHRFEWYCRQHGSPVEDDRKE